MYNTTPLRTPDLSLSDTPQPFNLWLWLTIGISTYFLLRKEKPKRKSQASQTPADLHGLVLFGIEDLSNSEIQRLKNFMSQYKNKERFAGDYNALPNTKVKKALDWYRSQIFDIKDKMPFMEKNRKYAVDHINFLENKIDEIPEEVEGMTFSELWNIGTSFEPKPFQTKEQLTLFGGLSGSLRTCDAWFETEDKRGFKTHRCFIYKPACNTKRCKADTNVSRETRGGYYE
jgi:hypothetical protein